MAISAKNVISQGAKRSLPAVLGALAGYAYYYFIGCASGTCPITSNPWLSTAYGALLGFVVMPRRKPVTNSVEKT